MSQPVNIPPLDEGPVVPRVHFMRAHRRLMLGALLFVGVGGGLYAYGLSIPLALLLGFDAGALVFLISTFRIFNSAAPEQMRVRAQQQDVGYKSVLWSSVALSCIVMVALWVEMRGGKGGGWLGIIAAFGSIVLSWLYMNTIFALHYAHGFYSRHRLMYKGLEFPGTKEPDYWDFAYFAVVIGMTFQVSDVQIVNRHLRRMALVHSIIAFFFNVFIIALSVNVVAGQA